MSKPEYEEESSPDNLVDCPLDSAYTVMSDIDAISTLLQQAVYAAHPDLRLIIENRPHYGLAAHLIDVSAIVQCYVQDQTVA